jgi:hypothetical protein
MGLAAAMHIFFAATLLFGLLWGMAGGQLSYGWGYVLAGQWLMGGLELVLTCAEFAQGTPTSAYLISVVGVISSIASTLLLLAFVSALAIDRVSKCDRETDLEHRIFTAAFPFDCGPSGYLVQAGAGVFFFVSPCPPCSLGNASGRFSGSAAS